MKPSEKKVIYSQSIFSLLFIFLISSILWVTLIMGGFNLASEGHIVGYLLTAMGIALFVAVVRTMLHPEQIVASEQGLELTMLKKHRNLSWNHIKNVNLQSPTVPQAFASSLIGFLPGATGSISSELYLEVQTENMSSSGESIFVKVYSGRKAQEIADQITNLKSKYKA
jgi:hypothetical protein